MEGRRPSLHAALVTQDAEDLAQDVMARAIAVRHEAELYDSAGKLELHRKLAGAIAELDLI